MRRGLAALAAVVASVALAGCDDRAILHAESSARAAASAAAAPSATTSVQPVVVRLGPAAEADRSARERAVHDLLAGGPAPSSLEAVDVDPGKAWDPALVDRLAPPMRPPQVRAGIVTVSGGLPPEVVQRIVRQSFGRFRLCYETALAKKAGLAGRVEVTYRIAGDGSASGVRATSDFPGPAKECIAEAFRGLTYPTPEGGRAVEVTFPLVFEPPT